MSAGDAAPDRELHAEIQVHAGAKRVWQTLTDLRRMPAWSPELLRMVPLKPGGLRLGQWYVGLNRRGAVVWPTRNVVTVFEPGRRLGWDTTSSGARWIYTVAPEPDGARVTLTRPVPRGLTRLAKVFGGLFLGGAVQHADELEDGMRRTLERLRTAVEQ